MDDNWRMGLYVLLLLFGSVYSDQLDIIQNEMNQVDASNCHGKTTEELYLPFDYLPYQQNREGLLSEASTLALNRALFYTITNQRLNHTWQFLSQPDIYYIYLSTALSLLSSSEGIIATGIYYDQNTFYPNFYDYLYFNMTVPLFAPHALRGLDSINVKDDSARNYTAADYKTGEWFHLWLPDRNPYFAKTVIESVDSQGNNVGGVIAVEGSNPVKLTNPYFDCGRTNEWVVTASSPVVDYLARYTFHIKMRKPQFVAVSTVDVAFAALDINQCDMSETDPLPNPFAGTHKCKPSTECRPVSGFGFRRGGYECVCKAGFEYPGEGPHSPYSGQTIESATEAEYAAGFECVERVTSSHTNAGSANSWINEALLETINSVNKNNCTSDSPAFVLPDIGQLPGHFKVMAKAAVRLGQLFSGLLQKSSLTPEEIFLISTPNDVNADELLAEVEAIILSDDNIAGAEVGIKMDDGALLSAFAEKVGVSEREVAIKRNFWSESDFNARKQALWSEGNFGEETTVLPWLRTVPNAPQHDEMTTWRLTTPNLSDIRIWVPEFSCHVQEWMLRASVPILGFDNHSNTIVRGETSVYVRLPIPAK